MKKWFIPIVAIVVICSAMLWFVQERFFHDEPMSETEATTHVEGLYNGQVKHIKKRGGNYEMMLVRDGATYAVFLDPKTRQVKDLMVEEVAGKTLLTEAEIRQIAFDYTAGDVDSVVLTGSIYSVQFEKDNLKKELTLDAFTGAVLSETDIEAETKPNETTSVITEQQAIQIALQQLEGEVDSIDYEETEEGGYFLVEIETKKDEAVFQIHAVSGKVLSVTWDKDE